MQRFLSRVRQVHSAMRLGLGSNTSPRHDSRFTRACLETLECRQLLSVVLEDRMDYATNEALRAPWNCGGLFLGTTTDPSVAHAPYMSNNNQVAYRDLAVPISANAEWTVSYKVLPTALARTSNVWLVDYDPATGTSQGYGVRFNSQTANGAEAKVRISTTSGPATIGVNYQGAGLSSDVASGHVLADGPDADTSLDAPFADIQLHWTPISRTLEVKVDGVVKSTYIYSTGGSIVPSFDRLYVLGNNSWFDEVVVSSGAVLQDRMDYTTNEALRAPWNCGGLSLGTTADADVAHAPFMKNNNQLAYRDLPAALSAASDWTVSYKVQPRVLLRTSNVWLVDYDAGTGNSQGYGVRFNSTGINGAQGKVRINVTPAPVAIGLNYQGNALTTEVDSGHVLADGPDADTYLDTPFADIQLHWTASSKTLEVKVDGVSKGVYTYTTSGSVAPSFDRLYVLGNDSWFDEVVVSSGDTSWSSAGASVPFTTYEAEAASLGANVTRVMLSAAPASTSILPETEASGRGYVELDATSEYVEFASVRASDAIVLRHSIPDAALGGGQEKTLSLYVNGVFRQTLTLSSKHNWLYGAGGANGQSNDPAAGSAHVYWNEQRYIIAGDPISAGSTIRLQKDSGDSASFYRIDCLDLELRPAALAAPATGTYLSVADYGANGADTNDDSAAIQNCINAAKIQGKIVWIPAGTYYQSAKFTNLENVTVQGAGMWYTQIIGTTVGGGFAGTVGFSLSNNAQVRDLYIASTAHTNRSDEGGRAFTGGGNNWRVENVWMQHLHGGFWVSGSHNVMRGNRIFLTYADALHIVNGNTADANNNLIEHNYIRGIGDDGIALIDEAAYAYSITNSNVRYNTVTADWWGGNIDLAGGSGNIIERNYLADSAWTGAFIINHPSDYPMHALSSGIFRSNLVVRGGGNIVGQKRGAIWTYAGTTTISNMLLQNNRIVDSLFHAIELTGTANQSLTIEGNFMDGIRWGNGISIRKNTSGSAAFAGNTVQNVGSGYVAFYESDDDGTFSVLDEGGNSWW